MTTSLVKPKGNGHGRAEVERALEAATEEDQQQAKRVSMAKIPDKPFEIDFQKPVGIEVHVEFPRAQLLCNNRKGVIIGGPEVPMEITEDTKLQGKKGKKRPPVDFDALFRRHAYLLPGAKLPVKKFVSGEKFPYWPDTLGFPSKAWKDCIITAAAFKLGLTPWSIKPFIHVFGLGEDPSLAVLKYKYGRVREDTLPIVHGGRRTGMHTTWRPELWRVETDLWIEWDRRVLGDGDHGVKTVLNALSHGGQWIGVGDGRNEKSGYPVGLFVVGSCSKSRRG